MTFALLSAHNKALIWALTGRPGCRSGPMRCLGVCFVSPPMGVSCGGSVAADIVTDAPLGFHLSATNALIDKPRINWTLCHLSVKSSSSHSSDRFPLTSPHPLLIPSHSMSNSAHPPSLHKTHQPFMPAAPKPHYFSRVEKKKKRKTG